MLANTNARLACRGDVAAKTQLPIIRVLPTFMGFPLLLTGFRSLRI